MDFSLTAPEQREEILRAAYAELRGGPKTGLSPHHEESLYAESPDEENSVLCFKQLGLSIVGRKQDPMERLAPT
jgi:hypothetical protein